MASSQAQPKVQVKESKNKNSKKFKSLKQQLEALQVENKKLQAALDSHIKAQQEDREAEAKKSHLSQCLQFQFDKLSDAEQRKYFRMIQRAMAMEDEKQPETVHCIKNGLQCTIHRAKDVWGTYNGYVKLPEGHPYHGKRTSDIEYYLSAPGGITYSSKEDPLSRDYKQGEWWVGYDHRHSYDYGLPADAYGFIDDSATFTTVDMMHAELDELTKDINDAQQKEKAKAIPDDSAPVPHSEETEELPHIELND